MSISLWSRAKVAPASSPGGSASSEGLSARLKGSVDFDKGRAPAELPGSPLAVADDTLEDEGFVCQLENTPEFQEARQLDRNFTLLHYVALLGTTTLSAAAQQHDVTDQQQAFQRYSRAAQHLVRTGHDAYVQDTYGCIPLQIAAALGNTELLSVLLQPFDAIRGASRPDKVTRNQYLNHQDSQIRFTALHGALNHCQYHAAILLLQHGANPQILDITRNNAFQVAPNLEALQELLHLVVQHEDVVPTPAIAQLMIEVIKQQQERERSERQTKETAEKADKKEEDEPKPQSAQQWARAIMAPGMGGLGGLDYTQRTLLAAMIPIVTKLSTANSLQTETKKGDADGKKVGVDADQGGEVGGIVRRLFKELYLKNKNDDIWEYVRAAVDYNNYPLTQMMLNIITLECPKALSECNWEGTLGPLIACFPDIFHTLIKRLENMSDKEVMGFVGSMRLGSYHQSMSMQITSTSVAGRSSMSATARISGRTTTANQNKILIYQQLVEGLKKVNYVVVKAFFENTDQEVLNDMAQFPIFKDFVTLIATKHASEGYTASDSGRHRLLEQLRAAEEIGNPNLTTIASSRAVTAGSGGYGAHLVGSHATAGPGPGSQPAQGLKQMLMKNMSSIAVKGVEGGEDSMPLLRNQPDLAVQTLDVQRVLSAAVHARKSMNVEAAVKSITSWVDMNSKDKRTVFISGISTNLVKDMAMRFPTSTSKLFNLVSKEVLEQLTTLQVSAILLHRKDQVVKCSDVRNNFTWRAPELKQLADDKGFDEQTIDALADYGIPFECTYKAAMDCNTTKEHFAALIGAQFTGQELKDLISNGIHLNRITDTINACAQPPAGLLPSQWKADPITVLLKEMLKEKLSFRIVEAIIDTGSMNEATVYINFRPGNVLYNTYPAELYKPKYTYHFVQLLLTNWRKGAKDMQGNWALKPWDKKFIDTIFAPNDPLCTALKSAYDNKLKDTPVYLDSTEDAVHGWAKKQRKDLELVLRAFVCNPLLIHRWPVFVLVHLALLLYDVFKGCWTWMGLEWDTVLEQQGHSIDAKALVIPWCGIADVGDQYGMLTGLIDVDVPVRWFGFTAVKAAITVQWQAFGQILMLMGALAHITFMVLFGVFLLIVRRHGERTARDMELVRQQPEVIALLVVLGLLSLGGLMEEAFQMATLTWKTWRNYLGNLVDLTSFGLFVVIFGMVWAGYSYDAILAVGSVETLVLFVRLVFFASMTDSMGSLMRMVIEIMKDMRYFFLLLGMIFGGFAIAFAVLQGPNNSYTSVSLKLFTVMLGDFQASDLEGMLENDGVWYTPNLSVLMMCLYGILIGIVLINLLIAIMNDTYDRIKETEEVEVLHNRARLIVDLESLLTDPMRDALQKRLLGRYLHVLLPADHKSIKYMAADEGGDGDWKGRMRHMREVIKSDFEPMVQKNTRAVRDEVMRELGPIKKWVQTQPELSSLAGDHGGNDGDSDRSRASKK